MPPHRATTFASLRSASQTGLVGPATNVKLAHATGPSEERRTPAPAPIALAHWLIRCQRLRAACEKSACCKWLLVRRRAGGARTLAGAARVHPATYRAAPISSSARRGGSQFDAQCANPRPFVNLAAPALPPALDGPFLLRQLQCSCTAACSHARKTHGRPGSRRQRGQQPARLPARGPWRRRPGSCSGGATPGRSSTAAGEPGVCWGVQHPQCSAAVAYRDKHRQQAVPAWRVRNPRRGGRCP